MLLYFLSLPPSGCSAIGQSFEIHVVKSLINYQPASIPLSINLLTLFLFENVFKFSFKFSSVLKIWTIYFKNFLNSVRLKLETDISEFV